MQHNSARFQNFRALAEFSQACLLAFLFCIAISSTALECSAQTATNNISTAIERADGFLRTAKVGKETLSYVHFGADYHGHEYIRTVPVLDQEQRSIPGQFALVYRFKWQDDGITDVAYLCDANRYVYKVQIMYTNAVLSPPFVLANGMIQLLGNALIQANRNNMTVSERRAVQKLVDEADAKGLLEWSLAFEQHFGN